MPPACQAMLSRALESSFQAATMEAKGLQSPWLTASRSREMVLAVCQCRGLAVYAVGIYLDVQAAKKVLASKFGVDMSLHGDAVCDGGFPLLTSRACCSLWAPWAEHDDNDASNYYIRLVLFKFYSMGAASRPL
eukprot:1158851-Pelagomonas_calceolata.AAC.6